MLDKVPMVPLICLTHIVDLLLCPEYYGLEYDYGGLIRVLNKKLREFERRDIYYKGSLHVNADAGGLPQSDPLGPNNDTGDLGAALI